MKSSLMKDLKKDKILYFLLLPGLIYFFIFSYLPMVGIIIAFKNHNIFTGIFDSPWVGFKHFRDVFSSTDFWHVFRNTLIISFYKLTFGFSAPIIVALLLNEIRNTLFKRITQTII